MRIISVVKHVGSLVFPGARERSVHVGVIKILFHTYRQALSARADLTKYFGKMQIKRLKGGYGLYTRSDSNTIHRSRYYRNRRKNRGGTTNSPIGIRFGCRWQH